MEQMTGTNSATAEKTGKHNISELEKFYQSADEQDKELFAEQRSNILLYAGEHYNRMRSTFYKRLREVRSITEEQRLRIVKNHTQKIVDSYTNHIMATAPGVGFEPANESELQDQKTAELNHSVWEFAKNKYNLDEETQNWAEDFTQIGEVAVKIFWDPQAGDYLGDFMDEESQAMVPQFKGDMTFEECYGFNLLIDPSATDHRKAKWMCIRKMVDTKKLLSMFPGEDNKKYIQEGADQTYTIFDRGRAGYAKSKDQCMLREMYFKPCFDYPSGYCYYFVKDKILHESELPAGRFPIVFKPFRKMKTRARGQSIIKTIRPFQAEINRAASKIAEHQITLGDDKVLLQQGTTLTSGKVLPGVRSYNFTGMKPEVMPGRDGSQYAAYMAQQISEMYNACDVDETETQTQGQVDPYSLLYQSARQKRRFRLYIARFEQFLIEVADLFLTLARYHYPDDMVIGMVGRNEQVNLEEFRGQDHLCYKIKIVPQAEDIETKLGKQLVLSQTLQYTAGKFDKEDIGKLIKAMPYANMGESFNDLTIDYEAATNDILSLDRGEQPPISPQDNHVYMIKRLTQRMRQADFKYLDPAIQNNYAMRLQAHNQIQAQQLQEIQMAESGFIPTDGYLVSCDFYVQVDAKDPSKVKRVRLPSGSLQWLIKKLETQGSGLDQIEQINQGNLAQIAQMMNGQAGGQAGPGTGQPGAMPSNGVVNGNAGQPGSDTGSGQPVFAGG
jgi:hypothetical protein